MPVPCLQYMIGGLVAEDAIKEAGASCTARNIQKLAAARGFGPSIALLPAGARPAALAEATSAAAATKVAAAEAAAVAAAAAAAAEAAAAAATLASLGSLPPPPKKVLKRQSWSMHADQKEKAVQDQHKKNRIRE